MSNKSEFHGDVGQAVLGNVVEAPRLSNVINLNTEDKPVAVITPLQRRMITEKVKDVVAIGDVGPLDVYRVLLTEFGAEKMDCFPRDRYKEAMALLDGWIADAKTDAPHLTVQHPDPNHFDAAAAHCTQCGEQARQAKQARMMMILQTIVMVLLVGGLSWKLWFKPVAAAMAPTAIVGQCHDDGKKYSVGSQIKMAAGTVRECMQGKPGGQSYWGAVAKPRAR